MITEDFTGYGARISVYFGTQMDGERLREMVVGYMSRVSLDCVEAGVKLIGHIKSITDVPDGGYLACSITNHEGRVRTDGELIRASNLEMILNIMIYGLDIHTVEEIVEARTVEFFSVDGARVKLEVLEGEDLHGHEHHDHDQHAHEHEGPNVKLDLG